MGRTGLLVSDFIISFMWVLSGVAIKTLVYRVLGLVHEPIGEISKSALSILNMFFFAFLAKTTNGGTYNPLTLLSDAITGDFSRFLFTVGARIPAQVTSTTPFSFSLNWVCLICPCLFYCFGSLSNLNYI